VVRLLQNVLHMVPQTRTNSPLTTFNRFLIHNKNKHGTRICTQRTHEALCEQSTPAYIECTPSIGKISGVRPLVNSTLYFGLECYFLHR